MSPEEIIAALEAGSTITVRGEGGACFPLDVPADGSTQRELLADHILKGRLTVVDGVDSAPEVEGETPRRGRKAKAEPEPEVADDGEKSEGGEG